MVCVVDLVRALSVGMVKMFVMQVIVVKSLSLKMLIN